MRLKRCPSRGAFIRFFEGRAPERKGRKLLAHLLFCPECLAVFRAAEDIRSRSPEALRGLEGLEAHGDEARSRLQSLARREIILLRKSRRTKKPSALRWLGVPAAGTAAALFILLVIIPNVTTRRMSGLERTASPREIGLLRPKGTVPGPGLIFEWTPRPGVLSYRLEILDRGLEPVYQSGPLSSGPYALPAGAAALIRDSEVYFWKIVAVKEDNQAIESEFARFTLQR
jgi:hypothetical protein